MTAQPKHTYEYRLWLLPPAFVAHVIEEYALGFVPWAQQMLQPFRMRIDWTDFYVVNAAAFIWSLVAAAVGWRAPSFSLSFAAMIAINGVSHIVASLIGGSLSPGTLTGVVVYLPLSLWVFSGARADGILSRRVIVSAFVIAVALFALAPCWDIARHGFRH